MGSLNWFPFFQDVLFWMKDKQEVEVVDFLLQVKDCIVSHLLCHLPCLATRSLVMESHDLPTRE